MVHPPLVLVLDDDSDTTEMYAIALAQAGFRTVAARDAADAMQRSVLEPPDVIVTDLMLFGSTLEGIILTRQVRQNARTHDVPVIVVTGRTRPVDRDEATRAGCDLFLTKPCLPDELAAHVRELVSARRSARHDPSRL